jgi:integrase
MVKKYADRSLGTNNGITPHKLRATFGTRYYAMTGDISATSTVMNHASIETTAAYYLKENADAKVWAADLKI